MTPLQAYGRCIVFAVAVMTALSSVSCTTDEGADGVSFDIDVDVRGTRTTVTVTPSSSEFIYFFDSQSESFLLSAGSTLDEGIAAYLEGIFSLYTSLGYTRQKAMLQFASRGLDSYVYDGAARTSYIAFAFALDPVSGEIASPIEKTPYETGDVLPSDNVITMTVPELGARSARVRFEPSCDDGYVAFVRRSSSFDGMSDDQVVSALLEEYSSSPVLHHEACSISVDTLSHSTSYSAFAFGVSSGVATTRLFRADFRTDVIDMTMRVWVDRYFDGDEVIAAYPGKYERAAGKALALVRGEATGTYSHYYYDAYYYYQGYEDPNSLSDAAIIATLKLPSKGTVTDTPAVYMAMDWGSDLIFFAFAEDGAGEHSDVVRVRFSPDRQGCSPISQFPD